MRFPPMTQRQIQLVRESFAKVAPLKTEVAAMFYARLFRVAPELRPMFPADLDSQGAKLMAALGFVVAGLDRLDEIVPQVHELGRRHAGYGATPAHYGVVGETLIWTLQKGLGEAFTPDVREAWREAYGMLAEAMIAAAQMRAA